MANQDAQAEMLRYLKIATDYCEETRSPYEKAKLASQIALSMALMGNMGVDVPMGNGTRPGGAQPRGERGGESAAAGRRTQSRGRRGESDALLGEGAEEGEEDGADIGRDGVPLAVSRAGVPRNAEEADQMRGQYGIHGYVSPMEPQEQTKPEDQDKVYKERDEQMYKASGKPQPSPTLKAYQPPPPANRPEDQSDSDRRTLSEELENPDEKNRAEPQRLDATTAHTPGSAMPPNAVPRFRSAQEVEDDKRKEANPTLYHESQAEGRPPTEPLPLEENRPVGSGVIGEEDEDENGEREGKGRKSAKTEKKVKEEDLLR